LLPDLIVTFFSPSKSTKINENIVLIRSAFVLLIIFTLQKSSRDLTLMNITVIVPTYRRPEDLARCLEALKQQARPAEEVIVTVRDTDDATWTFLEKFDIGLLPLRTVTVKVTGVIAAMNAGLNVAQGDIIAFTDDDAAPHADWLEKIEAYFLADRTIGGVGGRDLIYEDKQLVKGSKETVGKIQWFGRMIGNHHLGIGKPREVDILKGVNISFRRSAISHMRFDTRMLGTGAQVHFEVAFCTKLKKLGWKLIYDPEILVDHYRAMRFDEDQRRQFNDAAWFNEVHNETLALLEYLPPVQRIGFILWSILVGTRKAFGLVQWLRFVHKEGKLAGRKWLLSMSGRWQGWVTWQESQNRQQNYS
jgi:cellulose synthase/poly-beta-1,6-N-acetylglucosamine synthase-like glycosyltransferase